MRRKARQQTGEPDESSAEETQEHFVVDSDYEDDDLRDLGLSLEAEPPDPAENEAPGFEDDPVEEEAFEADYEEDDYEDDEEVEYEDEEEVRYRDADEDIGFEDDLEFEEVVDDPEPLDAEDEEHEDPEYSDEDLEAEEVGETGPSPGNPFEPLSARLKAVGATIAAQARGVELPGIPELPAIPDLPGMPDLDRKQIGRLALVISACLVVGIGAYLLGKGSGPDVEAARFEGQAAGKQAGAVEGAAEGYPAGFRKGRGKGFRNAYVPAYRLYYKRAFEQAGLDAPPNREITVPEP